MVAVTKFKLYYFCKSSRFSAESRDNFAVYVQATHFSVVAQNTSTVTGNCKIREWGSVGF